MYLMAWLLCIFEINIYLLFISIKIDQIVGSER